MPQTEPQILANVLDYGRKMFDHYLSKFPETELKKVVEIEGVKINPAFWLAGHVIWAEQTYLLERLEGPSHYIPWLEQFAMGATAVPQDAWPPFDELLKTKAAVHASAMAWLRELEPARLEEPLMMTEKWNPPARTGIHHLIRHESMHTGHLSQLCKVLGL